MQSRVPVFASLLLTSFRSGFNLVTDNLEIEQRVGNTLDWVYYTRNLCKFGGGVKKYKHVFEWSGTAVTWYRLERIP